MARPQKSAYPIELYQMGIYHAWRNMIRRCSDKKYTNYEYWGGRGIKVCDKWQTFAGFLEDMRSSYRKGLQLDRIDNDSDYTPENCRWATRTEQCNNRRSNRYISFAGKKMTISQWSRHTGIKVSTLGMRLNRYGWPINKALTTK